jgi:hypothetical protein
MLAATFRIYKFYSRKLERSSIKYETKELYYDYLMYYDTSTVKPTPPPTKRLTINAPRSFASVLIRRLPVPQPPSSLFCLMTSK